MDELIYRGHTISLVCPDCLGKITDMKDSVFMQCIDGSPFGDPRGWGCGWYGPISSCRVAEVNKSKKRVDKKVKSN